MSEFNKKASETTQAAEKLQNLWGKFNEFLNENSDEIKKVAEENLNTLKMDLEKFQKQCKEDEKKRKEYLSKITPEDIRKEAESFWEKFTEKVKHDEKDMKEKLHKENQHLQKEEAQIDFKLKEAEFHFNKAMNSLQDAFQSTTEAIRKKSGL